MTAAPITLPAPTPATGGTPADAIPLRAAVQQVREAINVLHASVETLTRTQTPRLSGPDIAAIERLCRSLAAVQLTAVAVADTQRAGLGEAAASTAAWLAVTTRTDGATTARTVRLATALDQDPSLSRTRHTLAAGEVSVRHAEVIVEALAQLPDDITDDERQRTERFLLDRARVLAPARLRREARRLLAVLQRPGPVVDAHHDQVLRDEEAAALAKTRLTIHDNGDGTSSGHFTVPTFAAQVLRKCVQQMTAPRRQHPPGRPDARVEGITTEGITAEGITAEGITAEDDWAHRQGLALTELLEHLPTDRLHGKVAATVVVTISLDQLRTQLGAAGTDVSAELSPSETRRLACGAGILPAVLDGTGLPLDLGRTQRLFTETQRTALAAVYDECAASGCDRPYAWSELHHRAPWSRGGPTDLSNAVPVCGFHHRRLHDPDYEHDIRQDPDHPARRAITFRARK